MTDIDKLVIRELLNNGLIRINLIRAGNNIIPNKKEVLNEINLLFDENYKGKFFSEIRYNHRFTIWGFKPTKSFYKTLCTDLHKLKGKRK